MKTWSAEQLGAFLASVGGYPPSRPLAHDCDDRTRRGEGLGLRWIDVDFENGRLSVCRALIPINGDVVVSEPKTARGCCVIALIRQPSRS